MWFVTVSPITNVGVNSLVVAPTSNTFLSQTFLNKGEATSHTSPLKGKLTICKLKGGHAVTWKNTFGLFDLCFDEGSPDVEFSFKHKLVFLAVCFISNQITSM